MQFILQRQRNPNRCHEKRKTKCFAATARTYSLRAEPHLQIPKAVLRRCQLHTLKHTIPPHYSVT
jgi:hypothetical protein